MIAITQEIDDFLSTNAQNLVTAYNPATTYASGDTARELSRIYKSITSSNLDNYPPNTLNEHWFDWDVANQWAMIDFFEDTITYFTGSGIVTFTRGTKEAIAIGNFLATEIVIEYLDDLDVVLDTETFEFPALGQRVDAYSYIYADFEDSETETVYQSLKRVGTKVRVTFNRNTNDTSCGLFVAGKATDLGTSMDKISLKNTLIGFDKKKKVSIQTFVEQTYLNRKLDFGNTNQDIPLVFVLDPSETSSHQKLVISAKITDSSGVADNMEHNIINWELTQN